MITEKNIITHLKLLHKYNTEKEYWSALKMFKLINPKMWIELWEFSFKRKIRENIEKKIRQYKNICKKSNKKQYLKAYK